MGYIIDYSDGEKAYRRIVKKRLYYMRGGVASYSQFLTNKSNMESVQETYDVSAGIDILTEEKNNEKNVRSKAKKIEEERKQQEKLDTLAAEAQKRFELVPKSQLNLAQGKEHVLK